MNINEDINISVPFPPQITAQDLVPDEAEGDRKRKISNAFIAYRKALVKEIKSRNIAYDRSKVSSLASHLWENEPKNVKEVYRKMSNEAQLRYNQYIQSRGAFIPYHSNYPNSIKGAPPSLQQEAASASSSASFRSNTQPFDQFSYGSNLLEGNSLTSSSSLQDNSTLNDLTPAENFCMSPVEITSSLPNDLNEQRIQNLEQRVQYLEQQVDFLIQCLITSNTQSS
jgi:hypothetical protein